MDLHKETAFNFIKFFLSLLFFCSLLYWFLLWFLTFIPIHLDLNSCFLSWGNYFASPRDPCPSVHEVQGSYILSSSLVVSERSLHLVLDSPSYLEAEIYVAGIFSTTLYSLLVLYLEWCSMWSLLCPNEVQRFF